MSRGFIKNAGGEWVPFDDDLDSDTAPAAATVILDPATIEWAAKIAEACDGYSGAHIASAIRCVPHRTALTTPPAGRDDCDGDGRPIAACQHCGALEPDWNAARAFNRVDE